MPYPVAAARGAVSGGGAPAWTPAQATTSGGVLPATWWKADALVLNNDDAVSSWLDSSANGKTAVQATEANQPTYKTGIINGKPAILFVNGNTTGHRLTFTATALGTIFVVAKPNTYTQVNSVMSNGTDGANVRLNSLTAWRDAGASADAADFISTTGNVWVNGVDTNVFASATWHVSTHRRSATTASPSMIGHNGATNNRWWDGYVAEIVTYATVLSAADRAQVESYLLTKYALP